MTAGDDLARHYIRALGLWAVSLVAQGHNLRLCAADDPAAAAAAIYWVASEAEARAIMRAAAIHLPGIETAGLAISIGEATEALQKIARAHRLALTADATVQARAAAIVAKLESEVEQMRAAGDLRKVNAEYRAARAAAEARGELFPSYREHLAGFKRSMLDELAAVIRATSVAR